MARLFARHPFDKHTVRTLRWTRHGVRAALTALVLIVVACEQTSTATDGSENVMDMQFKRIPVQFIAALGEPDANSGTGAEQWGLWPVDPGPRGVRLWDYDNLVDNNNVAPAGWYFDAGDWWLEENGLIMEPPEFPLLPGYYLVTGDREVTTVLTVHEPDENGVSRWELADGASLYDVTHLGCRSARYQPESGAACTPADAPQDVFRVAPGAAMPPISGCAKQDYAVLFVVGLPVES